MLLTSTDVNISAMTAEPVLANVSFYAQVKDSSLKEPNTSVFGTITDSLSEIIAPPSSNNTEETVYDKEVVMLAISNNDTISHTVKVSFNSITGADSFEYASINMLPGEKAEYRAGDGWVIYDKNGVKKKNTEVVDLGNSYQGPFLAGDTFTGIPFDVIDFPSVVVSAYSDKPGDLFVDFSPNGTDWYSSIPLKLSSSRNEVHRYVRTRRFFRVRFVSTSVDPHTVLSIQCIAGTAGPLTSPLNGVIQADADTIPVRPLDFNMAVAEGLYENRANTIKEGFNPDTKASNVPQDVWDNGGVYTGFPAAPVATQAVSSNASDTGILEYFYLETEDDLDYKFGSVQLDGVNPVPFGHDVWRLNFCRYNSQDMTKTNAGKITISDGGAVVFAVILSERGQSYCSAYTVPKLSYILIDRIWGNIRGGASASLDGYFFYRVFGNGYSLRFPFELQFGLLYFDDVDYLVRIPELVDIVPRIVFSNTNTSSQPKVSYRFVKVSQAFL